MQNTGSGWKEYLKSPNVEVRRQVIEKLWLYGRVTGICSPSHRVPYHDTYLGLLFIL